MKRRKSALIAVLTLIMTIASLHVVGLAEANYFPPPSIEIPSPISIRIYNESSVLLHVIVNALPSESSRITYISYCLDGKSNVTLTNLTRKDGEAYWTSTPGVIATGNAFGVKATLDNLSEGNHTLIVYSHAADGKEMSRSREFTVDYDYIPPQNPFGLPDNLPNGTVTLPPAGVKTGTPQPTINAEPPIDTGSFQPLENPLTYIAIVCISVPLLVGLLVFRKKTKKTLSLEQRFG